MYILSLSLSFYLSVSITTQNINWPRTILQLTLECHRPQARRELSCPRPLGRPTWPTHTHRKHTYIHVTYMYTYVCIHFQFDWVGSVPINPIQLINGGTGIYMSTICILYMPLTWFDLIFGNVKWVASRVESMTTSDVNVSVSDSVSLRLQTSVERSFQRRRLDSVLPMGDTCRPNWLHFTAASNCRWRPSVA